MSSTFLGFSTTPASNTAVNGIGIQGTNAVQNFDNAFREFLAIFRRDLDGRVVLSTKSAGYTAVANDNNAVIRFSAAATLSLTAAATLGSGWHCWVMADGGAVVIDPNASETINGATTITIPDGNSTMVICDGTNFRALEDYSLFASKLDAVQASVDVASATTTDIGAAASQNVRVTGTTTITGLGTVAAGTFRRVRFAGILTLTHNGTSLILPGAANITTAAGDVAEFISEGSGNWRCVDYVKSVGLGLPSSEVLTLFNASGSAPVYACRAWVNFNGTGTVAVRASGNVTGITDNGTGDYTVNFTTAMPDANYAYTIAIAGAAGTSQTQGQINATAPTTSALRVFASQVGVGAVDVPGLCVAIFR
jgi:hypothetical protein